MKSRDLAIVADLPRTADRSRRHYHGRCRFPSSRQCFVEVGSAQHPGQHRDDGFSTEESVLGQASQIMQINLLLADVPARVGGVVTAAGRPSPI
jgi:hypothetical protein